MSIHSQPRPGARNANDVSPPGVVDAAGDESPEVPSVLREILLEEEVRPVYRVADYLPPAPGASSRGGGSDGRASDSWRPDWPSSDEEPALPHRRLRGMQRQATIPPMDLHLLPLADSLTAAMIQETAGRENFAAFFPP